MTRVSIGRAAAAITIAALVGIALDGVELLHERAAAQEPTQFRTPWGDPDLQGLWSYATVTPLERPSAQAGKEFLSAEESAAVNDEAETRGDRRSADPKADIEGAYNAFWWDRGRSTGRTSLIVDPPDGRLPALTPEAQARVAARAAYLRAHPADSWEDRPLQERCILYHGVPPLPTGYNNNYQIVQTPTRVAILDENIHDVRIIPLDGRPHLPASVSQWNGDSRGRWEGNTLVVETTNYSPKTTFRFPVNGQTLVAVERFTRVAPDVIDYRYTITDPATYAQPFTVELPLAAFEGPIFEYACHEANYAMEHILSGARLEEKEAREKRR
jgi:hypothetical protein